MRALTFGAGSSTYTFPVYQGEITTNFANTSPATTRLPGMDGGYNPYGNNRAPSEVGNVRIPFTIVAISPADMQTKRDAVNSMSRYGVQKLRVQPADPAAVVRWCFARVTNVNMPIDNATSSGIWQKVTIDFQVSFPRWYSGTAIEGENVVVFSATGNARNTYTVTTSGDATTKLRFALVNASGTNTSSGTFALFRVAAAVLDSATTAIQIPTGNYIEINARAFTAIQTATGNIYPSISISYTNEWFRLEPGGNTIFLDNYYTPTLTLSAQFYWYDLWY